MTLESVACIDDLRRLAHRRVPSDFMGYYESGSYSESTLDANLRDLANIRIRQRVLAETVGLQKLLEQNLAGMGTALFFHLMTGSVI